MGKARDASATEGRVAQNLNALAVKKTVLTRSQGLQLSPTRKSSRNQPFLKVIGQAVARKKGIDVEGGEKLRVYGQEGDGSVDGVMLWPNTTAKANAPIAYFDIVLKCNSIEDAEDFRLGEEDPQRYDFLQLRSSVNPVWIYDNYTSPAALINWRKGAANCKLIDCAGPTPEATKVWVKARRRLPASAPLYLSYGIGSTHHKKIAEEEASRLAVPKLKREQPAWLIAGNENKRRQKEKRSESTRQQWQHLKGDK